MVRFYFTLWVLAMILPTQAQSQTGFATAHANKSKVLVEQPVKITIIAYSPTWFVTGLSIENMRVDGAFVQSFKRTLSTMKVIDGKQYTALEFYYVLFPYTAGELVFPALTISTSIPPPGDYKGKEVTLKTKPIIINVEPVPASADEKNWLVANSASISNKWSKDISNLKTGDVLVRTITTRAKGTLPSFIDEPIIGSIDFGEIYTSEPDFVDERDDKYVNGKRVDTYSYLLEEEGEFVVPEVKLVWYNPNTGRNYARSLPSYTVNIAPNPDMASMQSLKDSLLALNPQLIVEEPEEERMSLRQIVWIVLALIALYFIIVGIVKLTKKLIGRAKKRKAQYHNSEAYWFNKVEKQTNKKGLLNALYGWLDHGTFKKDTSTLNSIAEGDEHLIDDYIDLKQGSFSKDKVSEKKVDKIIKDTKSRRKQLLKRRKAQHSKYELKELNP